jgi:glycosyltransferase involved in cell wall biosynthesis
MVKSILFIIHAPWTDRLGLSRVSMRIFEHLREIGWHCDYLCLDRPFLKNPLLNRCFNIYFIQREVLRYIRKYGHRYTAIQVEHNLIRYSRSMYNYSGKLIAKSNGLDQVGRYYRKKFNVYYPSKAHHKIIHFLNDLSSGGIKVINNAFVQSDQIHVLTNYELEFLEKIGYKHKTYLIGNGLSNSESINLFSEYSAVKKYISNLIVTIGTWGPGKGSNEWPKLVRELRAVNPSLSFRFLGTGFNRSQILPAFDNLDHPSIEIIPEFEPKNLPILLKDAKLGVFMSYCEGFPIGFLEMLASGTPIVTWDVPGPKEMYQHELKELMVYPGNLKATLDVLIYCINMKFDEYEHISSQAIKISQKFNWKDIVNRLADII